MRILILPGKREAEKRFSGKAEELVREMGMKPDEVIVLRNGKPIPIDERVSDNDEITLLRVSSGG